MLYYKKNDLSDDRSPMNKSSNRAQTHTHEFQGSTKLEEAGEDRHNHRFAGVTSQAIPIDGDRHVHAILANTDFFDHNHHDDEHHHEFDHHHEDGNHHDGGHHHEVGAVIHPDIPIPNSDKHIHLVTGTTTKDDGHTHDFIFTTLIDNPLD